MNDTERLAALLEAEIDGRLRLGKRSIRELAARLIAQGVRVGDDGLRAAVRRLLAEYDEDMTREPSFVTIGLLRAALAESSDA